MNTKKILNQPPKLTLIVTIILVIASIALFVASSTLNAPSKNEECITYNTLISLNKDEEGKYVKLKLAYVPECFAVKKEKNSQKNYYFAWDENDYWYIIRLTDETYKKIENEFNNNPEGYTYELKGYIFNTPSEIKKLAIESFNDGRIENRLAEEDFTKVFGQTYLDEKITPNTGTAGALSAIGILTTAFSVILIPVYISNTLRTKKAIQKYGKEEIEIALSNESNESYPKAKTYLTEKYLISHVAGLSVIPYENIYWAYIYQRRYRGVTTKYVLVYTKDKKCTTVAYINDDEILKNVLIKISEKNNSALIGFTTENQKAYRDLPKIKE